MTIAALMGGLTATLVFELCTRVRKFFDVAYVPIYFQFLPLEVLNEDLSIYLGDDFYMGAGQAPRPTGAEAARLRARIHRRGTMAVAVSALVIPGVAAAAVAQYMARDGLWPAIVGILSLLAYRIAVSVRDFRHHAHIASRGTMLGLLTVYVVYALTTAWVFHFVYSWTRIYVEAGSYTKMLTDLLYVVIGKVVVSGVVMAALAALFLKYLTDREIPSLEGNDAAPPRDQAS